MYVTYKDVLELPEMQQAQVIAGKEGMTKIIRWCHVIEIEDLKEWTSQNILVITTGVALSDIETSMLHMLEILSKQNSAGWILAVGSYIKEVPKSVIEMADKLDFPLLIIPEKVKLVDLTYKIGRLVFEKQSKNNRLNLFLENVILDSAHNNDEAELEYYGYIRDIKYRVVVVQHHKKGKSLASVSENIYIMVSMLSKRIHRKIFVLTRMNQIVLLVPEVQDLEEITLTDILAEISRISSEYMEQNTFRIGVSNPVEHYLLLSMAYGQVKTTLEKGELLFPEKPILFYSDLGIFRITDLDNEAEMESIAVNALGDLITHPDLMETLQTYIACDMNMQDTANQLFIHVNSMKYRLKKINSLLPQGLMKGHIYSIQTGLYLYHILETRGQKDK